MTNTPVTAKQVQELKSGQAILSHFPNRRARRHTLYNSKSNSSKLSKTSMNNPEIYRTGKHNGSFPAKS